MEWVETTAKTVEEAKDLALDQLGVMADEAEFEVLEEPRPGLFGRLRGEARVRARVRPASVRPKQPRRGREGGGRGGAGGGGDRRRNGRSTAGSGSDGSDAGTAGDAAVAAATATAGAGPGTSGRAPASDAPAGRSASTVAPAATANSSDRSAAGSRRGDTERANDGPAPSVEDVAQAAETFMSGLATAFGFDVTTSARVDGIEIEVNVEGQNLGLLVGPGGRTLLAIQDLTRVAAQRRLGDHETRLRVDVAGYRERRRQALERFAASVAETVRETGAPRALDPMPSADRKIVHDVLTGIDGVSSRSEGEEPHRRIVVVPA
jgi:spoIIIJ-associated protein